MAETTKKRNYTKKTETTGAKTTASKKTASENTENSEAKTVTETVPPKKENVAPQTPVNMVVEEKAAPIRILYIDSAISNNEIKIGHGRSIFGSGKIFTVTRELFDGEFMTNTITDLIAKRKLIVLSGLTDEERKLYNCYYNEGEVVTSEGMFDFFFDMGTEEAVEKFTALCPEHRQLVATRFIDAYEKHNNRITRDKVEALNIVSKENDREGLFTPIVRDLNDKAG